MVAHHCWGRPVSQSAVVRFAAVASDEEGAAKDDFETLRTSATYSFVGNRGDGRAVLETAEFDRLADYLYDVCDWPAYKVDRRLKHFETDHYEFGGWSPDGRR